MEANPPALTPEEVIEALRQRPKSFVGNVSAGIVLPESLAEGSSVTRIGDFPLIGLTAGQSLDFRRCRTKSGGCGVSASVDSRNTTEARGAFYARAANRCPECEPWVDPARIDHPLHRRGRNGSSRRRRNSLAGKLGLSKRSLNYDAKTNCAPLRGQPVR